MLKIAKQIYLNSGYRESDSQQVIGYPVFGVKIERCDGKGKYEGQEVHLSDFNGETFFEGGDSKLKSLFV